MKFETDVGRKIYWENPEQNLRDNAERFTKELEINVGSEEAKIQIEQDKTLNKNNKWITEM